MALDERQWGEMAKLYTPDATAEQPEGHPLLKGPKAIVAMISAAIDWLGPTHHALSNYIVSVDGDRAEASCYVRGYHAGAREHADKFEETLGRLSAQPLARTARRLALRRVRRQRIMLMARHDRGLSTANLARRVAPSIGLYSHRTQPATGRSARDSSLEPFSSGK